MTGSGDRELDQWITGVLADEVVVSRLVRLVVQQFARDLKTGGRRGLWYDAERAAKVLRFCQLQKHSTGAFDGKPFLLEPWQKFIFASLFGWKRKSDNFRRYREAFITCGRGNGKSPMAALILLILMVFDDPPEPRAEIKCCATERAQAFIVWDELRRMIEQQPAIRRRCKIYGGRPTSFSNSIVWTPTGSSVVPLGKESKTKDGFNLHAYICDEEHAFAEEHRGMLEKLSTAMGKRRQPLAVTTTTAGSDRSTIWKAHRDFAAKVAEGIVQDDGLFPFLCEIDEGDDPYDEAVWPKANPNLDVSVQRDYLRRFAERAKVDPVKRHDFNRYHMNVLVSSLNRAIEPALWARGNAEPPELDGRECFAGVDLGWRNDLASVGLVFPLEGKYALTGQSWIPAETERDLSLPPWAGFIESGVLRVTEGNTTDWRAIVQYLVECSRRYRLRTVALDGNNARVVGTELVSEHGLEVFEFLQTCGKYNEPTRELLTLLEEGRLLHGGDPLLAWAASNLMLKSDSRGYVMPCKAKSAEKIDPMVAGIMALSECLFAEGGGGVGVDFL